MPEPFPNLDTHDRKAMKDALKNWWMHTPARKFYLGIIADCEFGVVCPDRAAYPGLKFTVNEVGSSCASGQHLDTDTSLTLIKKYGNAEALNGKHIWMFSEGSGSSIQRIVCLADHLYEDGV